jgi:hypothetical protein
MGAYTLLQLRWVHGIWPKGLKVIFSSPKAFIMLQYGCATISGMPIMAVKHYDAFIMLPKPSNL